MAAQGTTVTLGRNGKIHRRAKKREQQRAAGEKKTLAAHQAR